MGRVKKTMQLIRGSIGKIDTNYDICSGNLRGQKGAESNG